MNAHASRLAYHPVPTRLWIGTLLLLGACAYGTQTAEDQSSASHNVLMRADLERIVAATAFEAIERLRPRWLQSRGPTSMLEPQGTLPTVYVDGRPAGDLTALNVIPVEEIHEIRYLSAAEATTRWGTGVSGGVIEVITGRRQP